jgi:hypothetical protein
MSRAVVWLLWRVSVTARLWQAADSAAHFLYCPGMGARRSARARWHHRVHLIPGCLLRLACGRLDGAAGEAAR